MFFFFFDTMEKLETPFLCYKDKLSDNSLFYFFSLNLEDSTQRELFDKYLVSIYEGKKHASTIELTKRRIIKTFKTKLGNTNWLIGSTAEIYLHLLLNVLNYNQECLYQNLEENSIKKGFDGVYTDSDNKLWILESKAGADTSEQISHLSKVKEAYTDLTNKLSGTSENEPNDPWMNALHHADSTTTSDDIKTKISKLSEDYVLDISHSIDEYNIIPSGTVFIVSENEPDNFNDVRIIKDQINEYFKDKDYKNLIVICSTQKAYKSFLDYIGVPYEK